MAGTWGTGGLRERRSSWDREMGQQLINPPVESTVLARASQWPLFGRQTAPLVVTLREVRKTLLSNNENSRLGETGGRVGTGVNVNR